MTSITAYKTEDHFVYILTVTKSCILTDHCRRKFRSSVFYFVRMGTIIASDRLCQNRWAGSFPSPSATDREDGRTYSRSVNRIMIVRVIIEVS